MFTIHHNFDNTFDNLGKGDVIVKENFLQEMNYMDRLINISYAAFPPHKREEIKQIGFEKMHEVCTAKEIYETNVKLTEHCKPVLAELTENFVRSILKHEGDLFIDNLPIVRFYVPHDFYNDHKSIFENRRGFLKIQGPHHDTWFGHALDGCNLWMALGRVKNGNSLSVYPEMWGKYVEHDGTEKMPKTENLGPAVNFELNPGDLLLFHGELVHASELNITDETRFVMTSRFSLKAPKFKYGGNHPWITK